MQVHIKTYGCTLNQADSDLMKWVLESDGIAMASQEESDVVVVNTCTVKTPTAQKILHAIERLESSGKRVVVTGCMASANQALIESRAPKASIVTTSNISSITRAVLEAANGRKTVINGHYRKDKLVMFDHDGAVIAKVPVSEGCLSSCGFCETKFARGPLNSFSEDLIVNAVSISARRGAKEIQLTSQDMGAYGIDRKTDIARLMGRLSAIDGDFKIRVGMLNPEHLGRYLDGLINAMQSDRFYKFIHLPVQSGSNRVLQAMKRMYTIEQFDEYAARLRDGVPGITIETDIIVGYPTETWQDFGETLDFVERTKPNVVNMCRFWARPHAPASKLPRLPDSVITERSSALARVVRRTQQRLNDTFVGKELNVLVTEEEERSFNARTDNYKKVIIKKGASNASLGLRVKARIDLASCNVLYGIPVQTLTAVV